jgi:hypothetical protein
MITPTARSTTLPFIANSLNSDANPMRLSLRSKVSGDGCRAILL